MKRLLLASLLCGFTWTVSAQSVTIAADTDAAIEQSQRQSQRDATRDEDRWFADRHCLRQTGSRIVAAHNARASKSKQRCVAASGRVYTREDIDATGSIDLADALRNLDPSIY